MTVKAGIISLSDVKRCPIQSLAVGHYYDDGSCRCRVRLLPDDRWVACSKAEFGPVGENRHIVRVGGLTTVCGASATHPDIWRGNSTKPRCPACLRLYRNQENR